VGEGKEIKPVIKGGKAYLRLKLPPKEVIVIKKEVEKK
jgi:hypothetical protein